MSVRAAAFTIRDKQLEEKKEREKVEDDYERRMDILMELGKSLSHSHSYLSHPLFHITPLPFLFTPPLLTHSSLSLVSLPLLDRIKDICNREQDEAQKLARRLADRTVIATQIAGTPNASFLLLPSSATSN